MKAFYLFRGLRGYNRAMLRIQEIGKHPQRAEIERRLKAIYLLDKGLVEEMKAVLGVSRSTVYGWKKRLKQGGGNVHALAPGSRAPQKRRQRQVDVRLIEFIRKYRLRWPGIGKTGIKAGGRRRVAVGARGWQSLAALRKSFARDLDDGRGFLWWPVAAAVGAAGYFAPSGEPSLVKIALASLGAVLALVVGRRVAAPLPAFTEQVVDHRRQVMVGRH